MFYITKTDIPYPANVLTGTYWEHGNQNEIDIVAINKLTKNALIAGVKLNSKKYRLNKLKHKAKNLTNKLRNYKVEYKGFSQEDI